MNLTTNAKEQPLCDGEEECAPRQLIYANQKARSRTTNLSGYDRCTLTNTLCPKCKIYTQYPYFHWYVDNNIKCYFIYLLSDN